MLTKLAYRKGLTWPKELGLAKLKPAYSTALGAMFEADAINLLTALPSDSVDLVMTSPPFALTRKKEYGNEPVDRYIEWFMPFCAEIKRILKPTGSFVLDIGGACMVRTARFARTATCRLTVVLKRVLSRAGFAP